MAIATLDLYKAALTSKRKVYVANVGPSTTAGRFSDSWPNTAARWGEGLSSAAPSTAVVPTSGTAGAMGQPNPSSGQLSIVGANFTAQPNTGAFFLCDRLSHQGGLSGTVTTPQTTNLPTAALTRYTSGEGVMIGLSIYSQVGTTGTTVSATYTNSLGNGSRVTPLVVFGGTGFRENNRMILLPLQSGDTGVQSVQSVTVTATTGTAGNFGVTLFKPLAALCAPTVLSVNADIVSGGLAGGIAKVENDACVFWLVSSSGSVAVLSGEVKLAEN